MCYKQMDSDFARINLSLADSLEKNRSLSRMEKIRANINWDSIKGLLLKQYTIGKKTEEADAYPRSLFSEKFMHQQNS